MTKPRHFGEKVLKMCINLPYRRRIPHVETVWPSDIINTDFMCCTAINKERKWHCKICISAVPSTCYIDMQIILPRVLHFVGAYERYTICYGCSGTRPKTQHLNEYVLTYFFRTRLAPTSCTCHPDVMRACLSISSVFSLGLLHRTF